MRIIDVTREYAERVHNEQIYTEEYVSHLLQEQARLHREEIHMLRDLLQSAHRSEAQMRKVEESENIFLGILKICTGVLLIMMMLNACLSK